MPVSERSSLSWLGRTWDRIWFGTHDALPLDLLRISMGALLAFFFIALYQSWEPYYSPRGIPSLNEPYGLTSLPWSWNLFILTEGIIPMRAFWWMALLASVSLTVGWNTRSALLALYAIQTSMANSNWTVTTGEDYVFNLFYLYAFFGQLDTYLSLDRWLKERKGGQMPPRTPVAIWPARLMQVHVALIYAFSVVKKLHSGVGWWNGEILYWVLLGNMWSRWPWPELLYGGLLSKLATYGTLAFEILFPIFIWFRWARPWLLVSGVFFQLGIAFFIQHATVFTLSMICLLWVYVPAETIRRWQRKMKGAPNLFRLARKAA